MNVIYFKGSDLQQGISANDTAENNVITGICKITFSIYLHSLQFYC